MHILSGGGGGGQWLGKMVKGLRCADWALARVAQLVGVWSVHQKVPGPW